MRIDNILKYYWLSRWKLNIYRKQGLVNWMWGKWWIQFTNLIRKIDFVKEKKLKRLLRDLDYVSDIHDLAFNKGWWVKQYFIANYNLVEDILILINWTSLKSKIFIWFVIFIFVSIFWIRYFKWTKFF